MTYNTNGKFTTRRARSRTLHTREGPACPTPEGLRHGGARHMAARNHASLVSRALPRRYILVVAGGTSATDWSRQVPWNLFMRFNVLCISGGGGWTPSRSSWSSYLPTYTLSVYINRKVRASWNEGVSVRGVYSNRVCVFVCGYTEFVGRGRGRDEGVTIMLRTINVRRALLSYRIV